MGTALEVARTYTRAGWRVVPIEFRKKRPPELLAHWQDLRLAETDLGRYFNGAPQNVGVLLGEPSGGLVDIDLDCDEAIAIAPSLLPPTRATFGRKSKPRSHYLYVAPGAELERLLETVVLNGQKKRRTLVEIRSTGGQTVFPGSTHETGEAIEWSEDLPDGTELAEVAARVSPAALREAVLSLAAAVLLVREGVAADTAIATVRRGLRDVPGNAGQHVRRWLGIGEIAPAPAPTPAPPRAESLDEAVARWNADHHRQWPRNSAPCPVCGDNASFGRLPKAPERWSCFSTDHPEEVGLPGVDCFHGDALDIEAFQRHRSRVEVLREDGYLVPRAQQQNTHPNAPTQAAPTPHRPEQARRILTIEARAFVGDDEPDDEETVSPEDWVIPGLVPRAGVTILGGPPKIGKTWVTLDMGISVAVGQPFCGHWPTFKGTVFALLEEDTRRRIQRRLWRLARGRDLDPRALDGLRLNAMSGFRFDREDMLSALEAELAQHRPSLLLIDALARVHGADENDRTGMRAVTVPLQDLCGKYGTAVVLVHHFRKLTKDDEKRPAGEILRGTSDLWALSRSVVGVRRYTDMPGLVIDAAGNEGEIPPSTVVIESGQNERGKPTVRLVYRGEVAGANVGADAKAILRTLRAAGQGGLGTDALRDALKKEAKDENRKAMGSERISAALEHLVGEAVIYRVSSRAPWILRPGA